MQAIKIRKRPELFCGLRSEKMLPTTAVYLSGIAPHTVAAESPAKSLE